MQGSLVTFNELLTGSKLFDIPEYQRSYAWEEDNLRDLWEDLYYLDPSKDHFFGTVLLKNSNDTTRVRRLRYNRFDVIDGQQRLTTSLILIKEILTQIKRVGDDGDYAQVLDLERGFLKINGAYKLNPQSGGRDSRIDDRRFFHDFIIDDKDSPLEYAKTLSQQRLITARDFFKSRLEEEQANLNEETKYLDFLFDCIDKISNLQIMQYIVDSEADAIRMFETVNDRGRPLTNLEKTKSLLMHAVYLGADNEEHDTDMEVLNSRFAHIYDYYEDMSQTSISGPPSETDIQRYHFISYRQPYKRGLPVYIEKLKDDIHKLKKAPADGRIFSLNYADGLERAFLTFKEIAETLDKDHCDLGTLIDKIYRVGRLANIYPLLLSSWIKFQNNPDGLARILKLIEAFTFRAYVIARYRRNAARTKLYQYAYHIYNEWDCERTIAEMKSLNHSYVGYERFENTLRLNRFFNRLSSGNIRYILSEYEIELNPDKGANWQSKMLDSDYQVEHIWPSNTKLLGLSEQEEEEHQRVLNKLGNLTIVSQADNKRLRDKPFHKKKLIFGDESKCPRPRIQTDLLEFPDRWGAESIKQREDEIVAFALRRWSVDDV